MEQAKELNYDQEIGDFIKALIPFGYQDIEATIDLCKEYDLSYDDIGEHIKEYCDSAGIPLIDHKNDMLVDTTYLTYDYILEQARQNIEEVTGKDILNDTNHQIEAYGNYCCSNFDYRDDAVEEIKAIIKGHDIEDFSALTQTFLKEIGAID